ncbi:MAG: anthranilate synthase component I family protein [Flavobacteriaceae bacterium]|nr:anthranilate synthase component I family protein [Flavobacteriaceae bacterium]MDG1247000.1 anthranilate synthase component I family protein [Flavobacteriaceae bacterium]
MKKIKLNNYHKKIFADTITPVEVYLKIRDIYPNSLLLENSDYMLANNNYSFICFNQIGYIKIKNNEITFSYPGEAVTSTQLSKNEKVSDVIHQYLDRFETSKSDFKFLNNGLFGFMSHESVKYFDSINIENKDDFDIPDIYYGLYQNIIAISQYNHEAHIFCNTIDNSSNLESIEAILNNKSYSVFSFKKDGQPESIITDNEYLEYVKKAKDHCKRGDVFQLVLSRRFMQKFSGDEFNVYRALRSINPSPYLFFFDYGDYKIFGSSPEAQIIIKDGKSEIHPIAGTFKRTGNDEEDHITATELAKDPKENSEHIMLVDLARNDLSRSGNNVKVEKNREIQFYSHVIHLVSKVTAILKKNIKPFKVVEDTFPAGTLTGAPKHKALELIEKYEKVNRNFYGGAIGYIDFNGNFNHAIIIRSFFSQNNILNYQAGAGIVIDSVPEKELEEVKNKLGALDKALNEAELIK